MNVKSNAVYSAVKFAHKCNHFIEGTWFCFVFLKIITLKIFYVKKRAGECSVIQLVGGK